ncbi:MAG: choice-of-anchor D domain-containing protein, partial [Gammaproteobacteria bacterium]|nr:choice-of-anchor D domain-containing protein [Gammaproteobacteria bacterium]
SVSITGTDTTQFAQSNTCTSALTPNATCTVSVTFGPTVGGAKSASLTLSHDAAGSSTNVALSGTGLLPLAVTKAGTGTGTVSSPAGIDCGSSCSSGYALNTSVTLTAVAASNSTFDGWSGACSGSGTCTVTMDQARSVTATFTLQPIAVSVSSLSFGDQRVGVVSANVAVTVTNNGASSTAIASAFGGTNASEFARAAGGCGSTLGAGSSCTINVNFTAASDGEKLAYLSITHDLASSPWVVALHGQGRAARACAGAGAAASCASITEVDIGAVQPGKTLSSTFTLRKDTSDALSVASIQLLGDSRDQFAVGSYSCSSLPCDVAVSYTPTALGASSATLLVTYASGAQPLQVRLAGRSAVSPANIQFGNQSNGSTPVAQVVTVQNTGSASMTVTDVSVTGGDAAKFGFTNGCTTAVAVSASCNIDVVFNPPTGGGQQQANLVVSTEETVDGSLKTASYTIPLVGKPTAGGLQTISLGSTQLAFANTALSPATPEVKTVTVTNSGAQTLSLSAFTIGGTDASPFSISSNGCSANLAASASCTISVRFNPTSSNGGTGPKAAWLKIEHDATGSPSLVTLAGTATGGSPAMAATRATLSFGSHLVGSESLEQSLVVRNTGSSSASSLSAVLGGTHQGDFVLSNSCGGSLAALRACSMSVKFKPTATGNRAASLTLSFTGGSSIVINLKGVTPGFVLSDSGSPIAVAVDEADLLDQNPDRDPFGLLSTPDVAVAFARFPARRAASRVVPQRA